MRMDRRASLLGNSLPSLYELFSAATILDFKAAHYSNTSTALETNHISIPDREYCWTLFSAGSTMSIIAQNFAQGGDDLVIGLGDEDDYYLAGYIGSNYIYFKTWMKTYNPMVIVFDFPTIEIEIVNEVLSNITPRVLASRNSTSRSTISTSSSNITSSQNYIYIQNCIYSSSNNGFSISAGNTPTTAIQSSSSSNMFWYLNGSNYQLRTVSGSYTSLYGGSIIELV